MLLRRKSISFASRKGTFCSVKPLNFSRKNGGLGLYKLCRCDEMLNIDSRNASDVNFCLRFVFQIKENSCPDFLLSHRPWISPFRRICLCVLFGGWSVSCLQPVRFSQRRAAGLSGQVSRHPFCIRLDFYVLQYVMIQKIRQKPRLWFSCHETAARLLPDFVI